MTKSEYGKLVAEMSSRIYSAWLTVADWRSNQGEARKVSVDAAKELANLAGVEEPKD